MDLFRDALLLLLAIYLTGLLLGLVGLRWLPEPGRYHVGALAIFLLALAPLGYLLSDSATPDFGRAARWLAAPVALWWLHQLWSHRERPHPHARPKPPGWTPSQAP